MLHCRQVFTGCSASQLRLLPFFSPGFTFLVATTIACCRCHLVRVTSRKCCWQSGEICQAIADAGVYVVQLRTLIFPQMRMISFLVRSCRLANVLPASRLPSSRPDTASFYSCQLLPPGFLGTREAGTCAGSRACFSFSFFSIFLFLLIFATAFRQPREMSLHALWKCDGPANT